MGSRDDLELQLCENQVNQENTSNSTQITNLQIAQPKRLNNTNNNEEDEFQRLKNLILEKHGQNSKYTIPRDLDKFVKECILARKYLNKKDGFQLKSVSRTQLKNICVQLKSSAEGTISQIKKRVWGRFHSIIPVLKKLLGTEYQVWKAELSKHEKQMTDDYESDVITTEIQGNQNEQIHGVEDENIVACKQLRRVVRQKEDRVVEKNLFGNFSESDNSDEDCPQFPDPMFKDPAAYTASQPITLQLPTLEFIYKQSLPTPNYRQKRKQTCQLGSQTEEDQTDQVHYKYKKQDCRSSVQLFSDSEKQKIQQILDSEKEKDVGVKCYNAKIAEKLHAELGEITKEIVYCDVHNIYRWIDEFQVFRCPQCLFKCKIYQKQLKNLLVQCQSLQQQIDSYRNQVKNKQLFVEKSRLELQKSLQSSNQLIQELIIKEKNIQQQFQDDYQQILLKLTQLQEKYSSKTEDLQNQSCEIQRQISQVEDGKKKDMLFLLELQDDLQKLQKHAKEKQLDVLKMQQEKQFFLN